MDYQGARHPTHRSTKKSRKPEPPPNMYNPYAYNQPGGPAGPTLFDDTSGYGGQPQSGYGQPNPGPYYSQHQGPSFNIPGQLLTDPMVANMAMQYGQSLVGQGKELVDKKLEKYVSVTKLKYYFAVDTSYVMKKLGLLFFPFSHTDWSVKYDQDEPVQPQYEINAPDLYVPTMAFVTYVLVAGLVLGIQNRFTPEVLGIQASSALVWLLLELVVIWLTLYIMNVRTELKSYSLLAFCSYKFVGMVVSLLVSLLFQKTGYYIALAYCSISLAFFLVRTLKMQILPESSEEHFRAGSKRRTYLLLFVAGIQPVLMWWLTYHLVASKPPSVEFPSQPVFNA